MKIEKDISLKEFTTFKIGGRAQFFCYVKNEADLVEAVDFAKAQKIPLFILGGGSNILISDKGFDGLVIKIEMKGIEFIENGDLVKVVVKAGENWDELVGQTVDKGLYGLENLSLIPGTVGATPVQNIGAYGGEVKDTIDIVRVYNISENKFEDLTNVDCLFSYRDSIFKKHPGKYIVVSVSFILRKNGKVNIEYKDLKDYFKENKSPTLSEVRNAVIEIRKHKLPDVKVIGTAGSFFKNSVIDHSQARDLKAKYPDLPIFPFNETHMKVSTAWIIDNICGYKGITRGNVGTYKNQALVLVNNGGAQASEVISLAQEIKKVVKDKTGIGIEYEVLLI